MSIDLETAKQNLLKLKDEYESRIDKIEDHIQNPQDDLISPERYAQESNGRSTSKPHLR